MICYACTRETTRRCPRCGRNYCPDHGGELCAACSDPVSVAPSWLAFRGSLLVLLLAGILALWLIVRPPDLPGESSAGLLPLPTPTVEFSPAARPSPTPSSSPAATPSPTATPAVRQYTVQSGDTLVAIAGALAPAGVSAFEFAQQIAAANGIDFNNPNLQPGQVLTLP